MRLSSLLSSSVRARRCRPHPPSPSSQRQAVECSIRSLFTSHTTLASHTPSSSLTHQSSGSLTSTSYCTEGRTLGGTNREKPVKGKRLRVLHATDQLKYVKLPDGSRSEKRAAKKKLRKHIDQERKELVKVPSPNPPRKNKKLKTRKNDVRPDVRTSGVDDDVSSPTSKFGPNPTDREDIRDKGVPSFTRQIQGVIGFSKANVLEELTEPTDYTHVATLCHGLDRVLFNPGVHWVQDPRTSVFNFTPFVQHIPDLKDFAFERLSPFTPSSRDVIMRGLASGEERRFAGSTSSLSGLLSHIYFLISRMQEVNLDTMAAPFNRMSRKFTPGQRMPAAVVFRKFDDVYLIDSDKIDDNESGWNVLTYMGTMLESFVTSSKDEFGKLLRSASDECHVQTRSSSYRYSKSKKFVMRSQLDCVDTRLPGNGVFDIKTRAVLPIRMDKLNFKNNSRYTLISQHGPHRSIDSEYYDLIRSAFLKYSFQARIGNMDGIFLAYHNTAKIFGFEYIPLEVIDSHIFGASRDTDKQTTNLGWRVFNKCVELLEVIAEEVVDCFPGRTVTCLAETPTGKVMHLWVQPVDEVTSENAVGDEIPIVDSESDVPIVQLDVHVRHYLRKKLITDPKAAFNSLKPWTLHWTISRSGQSQEQIKKNLAAAKSRAYRPLIYPDDVGPENIRHFLENVGFGDPSCIPELSKFEKAGRGIEMFRRMARSTRKDAEQTPQAWQIWRQPDIPDDPTFHSSFD